GSRFRSPHWRSAPPAQPRHPSPSPTLYPSHPSAACTSSVPHTNQIPPLPIEPRTARSHSQSASRHPPSATAPQTVSSPSSPSPAPPAVTPQASHPVARSNTQTRSRYPSARPSRRPSPSHPPEFRATHLHLQCSEPSPQSGSHSNSPRSPARHSQSPSHPPARATPSRSDLPGPCNMPATL